MLDEATAAIDSETGECLAWDIYECGEKKNWKYGIDPFT